MNSPAAFRAIADAAMALARLATLASEEIPSGDEHIPLAETLTITKHRSLRPLKDAIRNGEITAFGNQRSRTVKHADLTAWLESRRVKPVAGVDDDDICRRMAKLRKAKKAKEKT